MTRNIVSFVGCDRPTKVHRLTQAIAAKLEAENDVSVTHLDLSHAGPNLFTVNRKALDRQSESLISEIEHCDALIVGCPVYQGSYPGLFKHVFDLVHPLALRGRPTVLCAVGGGHRHALVVEHHLRPLFGFFEAGTVATGIYACSAELEPDGLLPSTLAARIDSAVDQMRKQLVQSHQSSGIRWKDVELLEQF